MRVQPITNNYTFIGIVKRSSINHIYIIPLRLYYMLTVDVVLECYLITKSICISVEPEE